MIVKSITDDHNYAKPIMLEITHLPSEMLVMILRWLPPSSLKEAVLVNTQWRSLGESPSLWEWSTVTVYSKEDIANLSTRRLRRIQQIRIHPVNWDGEDWQDFYRAVMGLSRLRKIIGSYAYGAREDVNLVEPDLFARSMVKLEEVWASQSSYDHIQALFTQMLNGTRIKKLFLMSHDLSQLEPGLFGRVLSRLEDLGLSYNNTTKEQMKALFMDILNNNSLKKIDLNEGSLRYIKPGFFARALSKIEDVDFQFRRNGDDDRLTGKDHLKALFTELSYRTVKLKRLVLRGDDLSEIETPLLANALSKLEELSLSINRISYDQLEALFTEISLRTQMKKLKFFCVDMSQLDPGLFGRVLARLEEVELCLGTNITTDQMEAFFTEMSIKSNLKDLYIGIPTNLSTVDPTVLTKALIGVEVVRIPHTHITSDQAISLLSQMSSGNVLMKTVNLDGNNLSSVDPEVLARAVTRLESAKLCNTSLTSDQVVELLDQISRNTQLKYLELGDDISDIDAEFLAEAVTKVKNVELTEYCNLDAEQITSIFSRVLEAENKLESLDLGYIGYEIIDPELMKKVKDKLKGDLHLQSGFDEVDTTDEED